MQKTDFGTIYLVATPIGNLSDISERAVKTLQDVDFIAAEDTRVSRKLLTHYGIKKPLVSYHEHNRFDAGEGILARVQCGESCALVTDAGMPSISDPGADLVSLCVNSSVSVVVIPGPSAVVSALALSGFDAGRYIFEGFLPVNKKKRSELLNELKYNKRTLVFYEAPHKLLRTLTDMLNAFGERRVSISRELTKIYEETLHFNLSDAISHFGTNAPRGEFVIVIEGASEADYCDDSQKDLFENAIISARKLIDDGMSVRDAVKKAATDSGCSRNDLYKAIVTG